MQQQCGLNAEWPLRPPAYHLLQHSNRWQIDEDKAHAQTNDDTGLTRNLTAPRPTKSNAAYFFTRRMKPSSSPDFRGASALRFWTCRPASVSAPPRSGFGAFGVRVMKPS